MQRKVQIKQKINKVLLVRLRPVIFDNSCHPIGVRPPYSLKYIESLLAKDGIIASTLIDQRISQISFDEILSNVQEECYDVIILCISTLDSDSNIKFCRLVKERNADKDIVIIGIGQEVCSHIREFDTLLNGFDLVLAGEAEERIVTFLKDLNRGMPLSEALVLHNQPDRHLKTIEVGDLDQLPFPKYDLNTLTKYSFVYPLKIGRKLIWGHLLSSRGCPYQCIFCSQIMRESYGKVFRKRSADNVVDEIEDLLKTGANIIAFDDDNFTTSKEHVSAICEEILSRNLRIQWIAHARIDEATTELLKLMKKSGCVLLRFGVESGSKRIIKILGKTNNVNSWFKKSAEVIHEAQALGISVACLFIVGSPTETKEDLLETIKFAKALSSDIIQVAYFIPFPGSKAFEMYQDQLKGIPLTKMYHYETPLINISGMNEPDLNSAQILFYKSFLLRPGFILRHFFDYFLFYLNNPHVLRKLLGILRPMARNH